MRLTHTQPLSGEEEPYHQPRTLLSNSMGVRPRRSASLSDSAPEEFLHPSVRMGLLGARRVTLEEKLKREREIALEEGMCASLFYSPFYPSTPSRICPRRC